MRPLALTGVGSVLAVGAHCDDIAIGSGATLLQLSQARPGLHVRALVLSGAGTPREAEERAALSAFCPEARLEVQIADLPDGRIPAHWSRAKQLVADLRRGPAPDLVIGPHRHDAHQDHRLLAELITQEFRDHLILGYEIAKYENDLAATTVHVPLSPALVDTKIELLHRHYPSQRHRSWFDETCFRGLLRLRGLHVQQRWAEAFVLEKAVLSICDTDDESRRRGA